MGLTAGTLPHKSIRYGSTEIVRVMSDGVQIWPKESTIQYVSSIIYTTSTGVFPTHQAGDLLVVAAVALSGTNPTVPAGWTSAFKSPVTGENMHLTIGYKFATAAGTPNPSWSGAGWITAYVFRNVNTATPFGGIASRYQGSVSTVTAPALTQVNTTGASVIVNGFVNNGSAGSMGAAPVGYLSKNRNARIVNEQKINTQLSDTPSETLIGNGSALWRAFVFELLPADDEPVAEPPYLYDCTVEYLPDYGVKFTAKIGVPEDPVEEAFMFRCVQIPNDGYVGRTFTKTWSFNGYSKLDCTLEDMSNVPGRDRRKIAFSINPRP
jgi:hypothetical protein